MIRRRAAFSSTVANRRRWTGRSLLRLEDRIAPAVTWSFDKVTGILTGLGDAANDTIVITRNQNLNFEVNGLPVIAALGSGMSGIVPVKDMTGLKIDGGGGDDGISTYATQIFVKTLTGKTITLDVEPNDAIQSVVIVGGTGNDTITGSNNGDLIIGGDGADLISAGPGDDRIEGTWAELGADLTIDGGTGIDSLSINLPDSTDKLAMSAAVDFVQGTVQLQQGTSAIVVGQSEKFTINGSVTTSLGFSAVAAGPVRVNSTLIREGFEDYEYLRTGGPSKPTPVTVALAGKKHIGNVKYEEISFKCGTGMSQLGIAGTDGDDTISVTPGPMSIVIEGRAGTDSLFVNNGGLPVSSSAGGVTVQGKAPVTFSSVESVSNGLMLFGDGARTALANNLVTITTLPGLSPDVTVFKVTNGGSRPLQSLSFTFSKIEYRYSSEERATSPGVTIDETFFDDGVSLADRAAGVAPGRKDITFTLPPLAPGQSATFGARDYQGTMPYFIDIAELTEIRYALGGSSTGGAPFSGEYVDSVALSSASATAPVTLVGPTTSSPTLIGATADGVPLTLNAAAGIDPYVSTFTPGAHLYLGGRMEDVSEDLLSSGNSPVKEASTSFSGDVVAFISAANNLVPGTPPTPIDHIYVKKHIGNVKYEEISFKAGTGFVADGPSRNPQVTGDGSAVFFESLATNLVPGVVDTNNDWDLFRYDVTTRTLDYVVKTPTGAAANKGIAHWGERADGRVVAFTTTATDIGPAGSGLLIGIVADGQALYRRVPTYNPAVHQERIAISPDGSAVAFWTDADISSLVGVPDANNKLDLLTFNPSTMQATLQSGDAAGTTTGNGATPSAVDSSFDFNFLGGFATTTTATDLAGATPATKAKALIDKDRSTSSVWNFHVWVQSVNQVGFAPGGGGISFVSNDDLRLAGSPNLPAAQLWVYDRVSSTTALASTDSGGSPAASDVTSYAFADDGRMVLLGTAAQLSPTDTDALPDVYESVAHRSLVLPDGVGGTPRQLTYTAAGYAIIDPTVGTTIASRPAANTDYVFLTGTPGNDSLTIDLDSGLTGLKRTYFDGLAGSNVTSIKTLATSVGIKTRTSGKTSGDGMRLDLAVSSYRSITEEDLPFPIQWGGTGSAFSFDRVQSLNWDAPASPIEMDHSQLPACNSTITATPTGWQCVDTCLGQTQTILCGNTSHFRVIGGKGNDTFTVTGPAGLNDLTLSGGDGSDSISATNFTGNLIVIRSEGGDTILPGLGGNTIGFGQGDTVDASAAGIRRVKAEMFCEDIRFTYSGAATFGRLLGVGGDDTVTFGNSSYPVALDLDSTAVQTVSPIGHQLQISGAVGAFEGSPYDDLVTAKFKSEFTRKYSSGGAVTKDAVQVDAEGQAVFLDRDPSGEGVALRRAGPPKVIIIMTDGDANRPNVAIANGTPPAAPVVYINDGAVQRSHVGTVAVPFNFDAQFIGNPADAFQLQTKAGLPVPFTTQVVRFGGLTTVYLTPTNLVNGSLPDGRYLLKVLNSQIVGGLPGGGDANSEFHRLFGDADGSGQVTSSDFLAFRLAFLSTNPAFDFDGNGTVDSGDFLQFRLRFLQSV